jgi:hypothetical protein
VSKRSRASRPAGPTTPATPATQTASRTTEDGVPAPAPRSRTAATAAPRSPLERYRGAIIGVAVLAVLAVGGVFLFVGAAQPAYACATVLAPEAPSSPAADATPRLGQVTLDLGRVHVETGGRVTYEFCPPTSGPHYNDARYGPIATRFYGADDRTDPQGWIHNLEHGMTTILYRCPEGCDQTAQAALRALQEQLPPSPLCAFPATSSVAWGRVYFLGAVDVPAITTFRQQSADRGPEPQCQDAVPGASPPAAPSASPAAPSASPAP